ncbi:MAG: cytochrome c oxidase subunit II [Candidatus Krumholzibacteriia bacterium]
MLTAFSEITEGVNFTFLFILVISVALLVLITALMVVFVIKYHRKRHPVPAQVESHALLEITWTVIPTILVLAMFYYGWIGYRLMRTPPEGAMEVTAVAQMWSWQFEYGNGKRSPELYVPVEKPVKVNLESRDVLHSFYVPAFMIKQDVVPGMENFVWFSAPDTGTYDIFCAEYCGERHSYMLSKVVVVPESEFGVWVEKDVAPPVAVDEDVSGEERVARLRQIGERLSGTKGCIACHSTDGSPLVGPTYKGLFGKTETVITDGDARKVVVDEEYLRRSILDPTADIVDGFQPLMPPMRGLLSDDEVTALVEYLKTLK